jgi:NADH dehydrogenase/NADH:ubiquinone reductase (non-electrogenic)
LDKDKYDVRVISPANHFLFTSFLPQTAVGTLEFRNIQENIRTVPGLGEYYQAKARKLHADRKAIECEDVFKGARFEVQYDYLVIACGCKTNTFNTPGVADREGKQVLFLKHLHHARQIRNRTLECFERATNPTLSMEEKRRLLSFVVVGGGPTSCEFTTELNDFLRDDVSLRYPDLYPLARVSLIEAGPNILGTFAEPLVKYYGKNLRRRGVEVLTDTAVVGVEQSSMVVRRHRDDTDISANMTVAKLSNGAELPFGMMVWSAGLAPIRFVNGLEVAKNRGKVAIDEYLRVPDSKGRIFALGDCAEALSGPLPPLASVAEQQGQYLADCFNESYHTFDLTSDAELPEPAPVAAPVQFPFPRWLYPRSASFRFLSVGSMASMGRGGGVLDMTKADVANTKGGGPWLTGILAFLTWRGVYLSKQVSWSNAFMIPMFWLKVRIFGRDVSRF